MPESEQALYIALLSDLGFESFIEESDTLEAYISVSDHVNLQDVITEFMNAHQLSYQTYQHDPQDWNSIWESNFDDIVIKNKLHIRAPFHQHREDLLERIIISPKMAFGTGHHATTSLILEWMVDQSFNHKKVLDFGCGTGILGIYARQKQCTLLTLIDIESQAIDNVYDTLALNGVSADHILLGSAEVLPEEKYDIIFANITRNVITEVIDALYHVAEHDALIVFSGFVEQDKKYMIQLLQSRSLTLIYESQKLDWICLIAKKD